MDAAVRKVHFVRLLKERLLLRFHMSLILIGTALSGLLTSKILLVLDVTNMVARYPISVVVAYLAFFGFIKLWLSYITSNVRHSHDAGDVAADMIGSIPDISWESSPGSETFSGGGGASGGAGASGSFDATGIPSAGTRSALADAAANSGKAAGEAAGEAASGVVEEGAWVLIVLGILLAIVFGAGIYLVYDAPFVLSEAAFDFVLAAGLLKSSRKIDAADWKGSVLRTTWKPFLLALLVSVVAAAVIHSVHPAANKLSDVF